MKKTILLPILMTILMPTLLAQTKPISVSDDLETRLNNLKGKRVIESLTELFGDLKSEIITSEMVAKENYSENLFLLREIKKIESEKSAQYEKELINFYPIGSDSYLLKIAMLDKQDIQNPGLRAIFCLVAIEADGEFRYSSPIKYRTKHWKNKKTGNVNYFYKNKLNKRIAEKFDKKSDEIAEKFGLTPKKFDFYKCSNYEEVQRILGIDYDSKSAGTVQSSEAFENTIITGVNSENFSHDVFHMYLGVRFPDRGNRNFIAEEGYANSIADAYYAKNNGEIISRKELVGYLKEYLKNNTKADLLELFQKNPRVFHQLSDKVSTEVFGHLSVKSTITSLICDEVEKKKGLEGLLKLLRAGKGEDAFFNSINDLIGIDRTNFNSRVSRLISSFAVESQVSYGRIEKAIKSLESNRTFNYENKWKYQGHDSEPWKTSNHISKGFFTLSYKPFFIQQDNSQSRGKPVSYEKIINSDGVGVFDYGEDKIAQLNSEKAQQELLKTLAFTPRTLLQDIVTNKSLYAITTETNDEIYLKTPHNLEIGVAFNKDDTIESVAILYHHEFYGDSKKIYKYSDYEFVGKSSYPSRVIMAEFGIEFSNNSVRIDEELLGLKNLRNKFPEEFRLAKEQKPSFEIEYEKYNENIHLLFVKDADSNVLVVEFPSFLLVSGVPFSSKYGKLVLAKVREIFPNKKVKYFSFGHHHPHYVGGIREFVHAGAIILSHVSIKNYIHQLVNFPHTIQPDSLQKDPKKLKIELFEKGKIIKDGDMEMRLIHIGNLSDHTKDYTIYYFPKYKLVFEEDLVWIKKKGKLTAARGRQKGLYKAIKDDNLEVENILQSWSINDYGVKSKIKFEELEETVRLSKSNF